MIYIHVMVLFIPRARQGQEGYFLSCLIYTAVWGSYLVCRVRKWYVRKNSPARRAAINAVCTACTLAMVGTAALASYGSHQDKSIKADEISDPKTVVFTASASVTSSQQREDTSETVQATTTTATVTSRSSETSARTGTTCRTASSSESEEKLSSENDSSRSETETSTAQEATPQEENSPETTAAAASEERPATASADTTRAESAAHTEKATTKATTKTTTKATTKSTTKATTKVTTAKTTKETVTEPPQPVYIYNNGEYTEKAFGYDGFITVTITIENDVITSLTASTDEEETEYFDMAYGTMAQDIINKQSPDVDGVSGATYSSDDIKKALKKCLEKARR